MPYDFLKYNFSGDEIKNVLSSSVEFIGEHQIKSGEVHDYQLIAKCNDYTVRISSSTYAEIAGSIHKSSNSGFNYNDFTINDASREIINLTNISGVNPYLVKLTTIEFGVNIIIPWTPDYIVRKLKFHSHRWFTSMTIIGKNAIYDQWKIKVYSKLDQWSRLVSDNVLRFENHYGNDEKITRVTRCGAMNLIDLFNATNIDAFRSDLIN